LKGNKLLLFDKSLDNWDRFGLIWNTLFFLWSAWVMVTQHDAFMLLFMLLFGWFFVMAYRTADRKRQVARAVAQLENGQQ
jgi:hypothetical protein